jgi:hypothetical protein
MQTLQQDKQLVSYLLGELPEEQHEELEERFCHDADLFERMLALRDDVIDDYLRGELSRQQSQQFERYFMATPQQRKRVENARALMQVVASGPAAERTAYARIKAELVSFWQRLRDLLRDHPVEIGVVFAVALLIVAVPGLQVVRLRNQLAQARQQTAEQRSRADRAEELARAASQAPSLSPEPAPPSRPEENVIASLFLTSDYDRGPKGPGGSGGLQKLVIRPRRDLVQLRLKLADDDYRSYRVTLSEVSSGRKVQTLDGLRAQPTRSGKVVIAEFPASSFPSPAMDYLVVLDGRTAEGKYETEIDKYSFRVEQRRER